MCDTCGCDGEGATVTGPRRGAHTHVLRDGTVVSHADHGDDHAHHDHAHDHDHDHGHAHGHAPSPRGPAALLEVQARVLGANDTRAATTRRELARRGIAAINVMSSPGAGKTTLLARTLPALRGPVAVVEGDQATSIDADRITAAGISAVQVNTGKGCHLEADMVWQGIERLAPAAGSLVVIENVGNLVCPALFDLGEGVRVVLLSVTEGDDKPRKYPHMFEAANVVVFTKIDLLPYVDFDLARARASIAQLSPHARTFEVSARSGEGMQAWQDWLDSMRIVRPDAEATWTRA